MSSINVSTKSKLVALRLTPGQVEKALVLSLATSSPGNLSEGLRWALDSARVSATVKAEAAGHQLPEKEAAHA